MNTRSLVAVASVLVLGALPMAAQEFPDRLSRPTRATLEHLADSARALRLPAEPLAAKAAEGVLKGADDARIVRAVRTLLRDMVEARDALPAGVTTGTLTAGASALHAGVSRETLRKLAAAGTGAPEAELALALITLADLAASRVPPDRAGDAVQQLLSRRAPASEMSAFREGVARDIQSGASPDQALTARMQGTLRMLDSRARPDPAIPIKPPM